MELDGHLAPLHDRLVEVPRALAVLLRRGRLRVAARAAEDGRAGLLLHAPEGFIAICNHIVLYPRVRCTMTMRK